VEIILLPAGFGKVFLQFKRKVFWGLQGAKSRIYKYVYEM